MMKRFGYIIVSLLIFLSSCDKFEWHNPYDPECPKELFTPSSPGATMEGNSVKLTWSQSNDDISGFALYRSAEGEPIANLSQTQKSTTQYLDASITPGKKYTYYVLAVAGTNKSDTVKAEITPVFPITISTGAVTELAAASAKVSGNITSAGGGTVTSRGICWSTTQNPTVNNSKTTEGTGAGQYTSTLNGLLAGTTYYARAYGENSRGIVYGNQVAFTTLAPPTLTTIAVSNITATSATSGGTIISDGGSPITAKGVVWSTSPNPTIDLATKTNDGTGVGSFTSTLSNLSNNTKYYIRAYATNIVGTSYGEEQSFTTVDPIIEKLKNGLVAYYPFNGNANDESGNGNQGKEFGSILYQTDRSGKLASSSYFNGSSFIEVASLNNLQYNPISYSVWINPSSLVTVSKPLGNATSIVGRDLCGQGIQGQLVIWNLAPSVNQQVTLYTGGSGFNFNYSPQLNKWNHLVLIWDQNGDLKLYVNGNLSQVSTFSPVGFFPNGITPFRIGAGAGDCINNSVGRYHWNGLIDDIRIYNRALTQEEITYLANN